jgi:1,4-dihydroxy-2-naphthoyl-CoA synthase
VNTVGASSSSNGRCSDTWHRPWAHLRVERRSPAYCRVTFDHPPINTITATTVGEFAELVGLIEQDHDLNVVVFDSANPHFFGGGPTGLSGWNDGLVRLARAPVVSIAAIRGRARGAGSELVLACDLRFASRENASLAQVEVGIGVVTEIFLVADDQLDDEVEAMASRLARFDHDAIARAKSYVDLS